MRTGEPSTGVLIAVLATALPALASPVTSGEFECQLVVAKELSKYAAATARCLVDCHAAGGCAGAALDASAAACADAARAAAERKIGRKCDPAARSSNACPSCYGTTDCPAQAAGPLAMVRDAMDVALRAAFCDDASSPDGLTTGEATCEQSQGSHLAMLATATGMCLVRCEKAARRNPTIRCDPMGIWDAMTEACISTAATRFASLCGCAEQPECRSFPGYNACPHMTSLVSGAILGIWPAIFCDAP
jgi:hypothetical protein